MIETLDKLVKRVDRISLGLAYLGGAMLLATVALIAVEIVLRRIFSFALGLGFELSGYVLAISSSWAFAYALFHKAHIRIDAAYVRLAQKTQVAFDILALSVFVVFTLVVCHAAWGVVLESIDRGSLSNTPLQTPLWIPQALWVVGLTWFALATFLLLARVVAAAFSKDFDKVRELAGSPTLDEQL